MLYLTFALPPVTKQLTTLKWVLASDTKRRHTTVSVLRAFLPVICLELAQILYCLTFYRDRPSFATALRRLESHPSCQSLSLHSFLMLPMQRVTRLPLLMDAVLKNLNENDEEYRSCMDALATLNHVSDV